MVVEFKQIIYANSFLPENMIYEGGKAEDKSPIVFSIYLLKTENRTILVDAGCDTMPGFVMNNYITPDVALERNGVLPTEITDVIITHSHHDHIDGVHHFKNAVIHIQEDEYSDGKDCIPPDFSVETFKEECYIDGIRVVKIGGHARGSCVVEFEYKSEKYVIAGDECYSEYNIKNKIPTATSYSKENSKKFIDFYTNGDFKILLLH